MSKKLIALTLVFVFLLVSCGGAKPSTKIDVIFAEFTFTPNTFTIPAGQEITVHAVNEGAVVHELVIMKFGTTVGENFGDEDEENIYWEVEVDPGKETTVTFIAPTELGEYQIVCGTEGHFTAGMVGTLIVAAGE
jgi:uncharacterized cupredoxin-like copper-binding protein